MPFIARSRLLRRRVEAIYSCGFRKHFDRDPTSSEQLSIVALVEGTLLVLAHSWRGAGTAKLTIPRWQFAMLGLLGDAAPAFLTKIEADLAIVNG